VRREWAQELGLAAFAGEGYDEALRAVGARLGVRPTGARLAAPQTPPPHNTSTTLVRHKNKKKKTRITRVFDH
jgi:hypothetical protein